MPTFPWLCGHGAKLPAMCNPVRLSGTTSTRAEQQKQTGKQNHMKRAWQGSAAAFAAGAMDNQPTLAPPAPLTEGQTAFGALPLQLGPVSVWGEIYLTLAIKKMGIAWA